MESYDRKRQEIHFLCIQKIIEDSLERLYLYALFYAYDISFFAFSCSYIHSVGSPLLAQFSGRLGSSHFCLMVFIFLTVVTY